MSVLLLMEDVSKFVLIALVGSTVHAYLDLFWKIMSFVLVCSHKCQQFLYFFNTDVNECELAISSCSDGCINTVGSYYCTCQIGYELANNTYTCIGN